MSNTGDTSNAGGDGKEDNLKIRVVDPSKYGDNKFKACSSCQTLKTRVGSPMNGCAEQGIKLIS